MTGRSDTGEARNRGPLVSSSQCLNTKCGQGKRFGTGPGRRPDWAGYGSRLFGQTHESMTTHRQTPCRHDNSATALFHRQPTRRHDHWPTRQVTDTFFKKLTDTRRQRLS